MIEKDCYPTKEDFELLSIHEFCKGVGLRFQKIEIAVKNPGPHQVTVTENPCRNNPFVIRPGDLVAVHIVTDGKWRYIEVEVESV